MSNKIILEKSELSDSGIIVSKDLDAIKPKCIIIQDDATVKICKKNGRTMIMVEPKEVKEEEPQFKKGDILSYTLDGETCIIIFKEIDKSEELSNIRYYCMLSYLGNLRLNSQCRNLHWNYATEGEKRTLFLAMLNKGLFWDENKMKVRTLKDGDIITIKDHNGDTWQSIFKEIIDNRIYSYFSLDCDGELYKKGPLGHPNQILSIRYSTTEERQTLFDKIEKQTHKRWNVETKCLENIRWRAKKGNWYWYIDRYLKTYSHTECGDNTDATHYSVNNYFQTKEIAEAAANKIKELLSKL